MDSLTITNGSKVLFNQYGVIQFLLESFFKIDGGSDIYFTEGGYVDVIGDSFNMAENSSIVFNNENNQFSTSRNPTILQIFTYKISITSSQILVDKLVLMPSVKLDLGQYTVLGNLAGGCFDSINGREMDNWFFECRGRGVSPMGV